MSHESLSPEDRRKETFENGGGSSYLAEGRYGSGIPNSHLEEDIVLTRKPAKAPKKRPLGRPLEGAHGIQESQRIAAEALEQEPRSREEIRESQRRGAPAVRAALAEAMPKPPYVPTEEEVAARRTAEAAEIRRKAAESWAEYDTN